MKPRKIVQVAFDYLGHGESETYALSDDGVIFHLAGDLRKGEKNYWRRMPWPDLPPVEDEKPRGPRPLSDMERFELGILGEEACMCGDPFVDPEFCSACARKRATKEEGE